MMDKATFIVMGDPKGKGRPQFARIRTRSGKEITTARTPKATRTFEQIVRMEYERQCAGIFFDKEVPLRMVINVFMAVPTSVSKRKANAMLCHEIMPTKKPDWDNLGKSICDAINGVAYHDDSQVVTATVRKRFGEIPRVEVTIEKELL